MSVYDKSLSSALPWLRWMQYIFYGSILLYFGRDILIPISFALLISFVLYPVCAWLERKGAGRLTAILITLAGLVMLGLLLVALLVNQFISFLDEWPSLQSKLTVAVNDISHMIMDVFSISRAQQIDMVAKFADQLGTNLLQLLQNTLSASLFSAVLLILVPVYSVLILYYRDHWLKVLDYLFPAESKASLRKIIRLSIRAYYNFIKGMVLVYLLVGIFNSIGLLLLGVPYAIFFGFIASVLTFIPFVGIIVGSLLPIAMAWITYDSIWYPLGIVAIFTFVQYLEANLIFPLVVSNRLHVNTLVMLIAIFLGGILWGVAGMILFVPFIGIIKLIADQHPKWKMVSMIIGMDRTDRTLKRAGKAHHKPTQLSGSPTAEP